MSDAASDVGTRTEVQPRSDEQPPPRRLGVLVSGRGSNLAAMLDAAEQGLLGLELVLVVSNRPDAQALERARQRGVATAVVDHKRFAGRQPFEEAMLEVLRAHGVDLVALAGFMRLLTPHFLGAFPGRVVNIHPALLPSFPGVDAQRQALDYGVKVSGCTVHFVDAGTDTGPIIAQTVVPVLDDDDQHSLAARILPEEHRLYVRAIRLLAEGRVSLRGRRVCIAPLAGVAAVAAVAGVAGATDVADGAQLALAATVTGVSMSPASPEARLRNPE